MVSKELLRFFLKKIADTKDSQVCDDYGFFKDALINSSKEISGPVFFRTVAMFFSAIALVNPNVSKACNASSFVLLLVFEKEELEMTASA